MRMQKSIWILKVNESRKVYEFKKVCECKKKYAIFKSMRM